MSIILETIKELEKKYKNSNSYLAKDDVIKLINNEPSFFGSVLNNYFFSWVSMWNCTDLFNHLRGSTFWNEEINRILFGFKSGIIINTEGIVIINRRELKRGFFGGLKIWESFSKPTKSISYYGIEELWRNSNEIYDGGYINKRTRESINKSLREYKYTERVYLNSDDFYILSSKKGKRTKNKINWGKENKQYFKFLKETKEIIFHTAKYNSTNLGKYEKDEIDFFVELNNLLIEKEKNYLNSIKTKKQKRENKLEIKRKAILKGFDADKNGVIDIIEGGNTIKKLVEENQSIIIKIEKEDNQTYIKKFVQISNYLIIKKENIQSLFKHLYEIDDLKELEKHIQEIKNYIQSYQLIIYHGISMVNAIITEDKFRFYEVYELMDKLELFNSKWENEISKKLIKIDESVNDLFHAINKLEKSIIASFENLKEHNEQIISSINTNLNKIDSTIDYGNLFSAISTYQLYRINKKIK